LESQEQKDFYWKTFERKRTLHYLGATQRAAKLFEKEGKELARLFAAGKEKEALNFIEKNEKAWAEFLRATWQGIVEEIGKETYNNLKSAAGFEIKAEDAFNPWEATIQNYIKSTAASKVVKMHHSSKKAIRNIIDKQRADDATLDDIAKAINDKYKDFSRYRAFRIARTEIVGASNYASIKSAEQSEVVDFKEWASSGDKRVRESHEKVDGQKIPLNERFKNGLLFPADYSADKPGETIQCRCTLVYFTKEADKPKPAPKPAAPPAPKPKPKPKPKAPKSRGHIDMRDVPRQNRDTERIDIIIKDLKVDGKRAQEYMEAVKEWSGAAYGEMRRYQMGESVRPHIAKYAEDMEEFIKGSPAWGKRRGDLYRGINVPESVAEEILQKAKNRDIITNQGTAASWTSNEKTANSFMSGSGVRIKYVVKGGTSKGTSITYLSEYGMSEYEVLVSKEAEYIATKIERITEWQYIIYLKEVE
jgi:SPP1 gp7 family putative phage head morphogenesis protein